MKGLNLWIAWKYNKKKWKRLLFSGIGVAISFVLISTALFMSDSVEKSLKDTKLQKIGNADLALYDESEEFFDQSLETILRNDPLLQKELDGISPRLGIYRCAVANSEKELVGTNFALVGLDFKKDRSLGSFQKDGNSVTVNLPEGTPISAVVTSQGAHSLKLKEGNLLEVQFAPAPGEKPKKLTVEVREIVDTQGKARFYRDKSIFVNLNELQSLLDREEKINSIVLSWKKKEPWQERQEEVMPLVENALQEQWNIEITKVREKTYEAIDASSQEMISFFSALSFPCLIAGLVLIVVIFYLLVDERRKELARLKAAGFHWWEVFLHLISESFVIGIIGSIVGIAGGIGATGFMLQMLRAKPPEGEHWYLLGHAEMGLEYTVAVTSSSILLSFVIGILAILLPTAIAAWRISRESAISALHERETTIVSKKHKKTGLILGVLSIVLIVFGLTQMGSSGETFISMWILGSLLLSGALTYTTRKRTQLAWSIVNLGIIIYVGWWNPLPSLGITLEIFIYILIFVYAVVYSCIFVIQLLPYIVAGITYLGSSIRRGSVSLMYGLATLRQHLLRTFLVLMIFSLVLSILFAVATFAEGRAKAIEAQNNKITMNSDFYVSSTLPLDETALRTALASYALNEKIEFRGSWPSTWCKASFAELSERAEEQWEGQEYYSVIGIDSEDREMGFSLLDPEGTSPYPAEEIWHRVFQGTGALLPEYCHSYYEMPLTNVTITGEHGEKTVEIVGFADTFHGNIIIGETLFSDLFPSVTGEQTLFFDVKGGEKEEGTLIELQSDLAKALLPWGPDITVSKIRQQSVESLITLTFKPAERYLFLGIIIGIVGITLVNSRKIQSATFEYGVLMSFGSSKWDLVAATGLEVIFLVGVSIIIGLLTPLVFLLPGIETMTDSGLTVPFGKIVVWAVTILLVTLISSLIPFYQILRLQPTEALQYRE